MDNKPKTFRKDNSKKEIRLARQATAREAIGDLEKSSDLFILTFGQFSLIDALHSILQNTGPANVAISTWTAATAHLDESKELMRQCKILDFKMIVDVSFKSRQPEYVDHMIDLFGPDCIRSIKTHAKFMLIRNAEWNIVVRTSMNLNGNPRLENIEISDSLRFAEFFQSIVDDIFIEVKPEEKREKPPALHSLQDTFTFLPVSSGTLQISNCNEVKTSHAIEYKRPIESSHT